MRVAVIGAGRLGKAIGRRLRASGHQIVFGGGVSAQEAAAEIGVSSASDHEAASGADVIALAVPFGALHCALVETGALDGAVVWCCVNALKSDLSGLAVGFDTSAAEEIAKLAPGALVVSAIPPFAEALNGDDLVYDGGLEPTVFVCGDDESAKTTVARLVYDLGAQPVDVGSLDAARLVEPAMMLLVRIAYAGLPRDVGLRLLERS